MRTISALRFESCDLKSLPSNSIRSEPQTAIQDISGPDRLHAPLNQFRTQRARRASWCREATFWPRDNFCRSIAAQLPSPRGNFERGKKCPLLWGRGNLGGILRDCLSEGNWESKIAARQWGVNFAARHQDVSQGPLGINFNQKRPFVHNSGSRFLEGLLAILAECSQFCLRSLLTEIQEEIHHFAG